MRRRSRIGGRGLIRTRGGTLIRGITTAASLWSSLLLPLCPGSCHHPQWWRLPGPHEKETRRSCRTSTTVAGCRPPGLLCCSVKPPPELVLTARVPLMLSPCMHACRIATLGHPLTADQLRLPRVRGVHSPPRSPSTPMDATMRTILGPGATMGGSGLGLVYELTCTGQMEEANPGAW